MDNYILDFIAKIAWPFVALIAIIVLGPGGVLKSIVKEFSENAIGINNAVSKFKETAIDLEKTQKQLKESTEWVSKLENQISYISEKIEKLNETTQNLNDTTTELAITDFNRNLTNADFNRTAESPESTKKTESIIVKSSEEMYDDLNKKWSAITDKLEKIIGKGQFDARSIGQMAWKLVDGRRTKQITTSDAELFGRLHSQMKRFMRLKSTKDEWLTHDIYENFVRLLDQADITIS